MQRILRHADRDAIWRDPVPEHTAGQVIPFPQQHHPQHEEESPEHDWTQHDLGDPEHWEEENHFRHIDAALDAQGNHQFPGVQSLTDTGQELGTHKAQVHQDPATGESWLIKQAPSSAPFLAHGDVAASAIQQYSGLKTPPTFLTQNNGSPASAQLMFKATDAFPGKQFDPEKLSDPDLMTIQKHHALDWLLGNHDSHGGQFIRDENGDLVGIDKGQAFKHFNQDRLHWNYHPNSSYNETEPVYNTLYRNFAQSGRQINDPRQGELGQFIQHLQDIPDDDLVSTLSPYAQGAADAGQLGLEHGNYNGHSSKRFQPNNVNSFLLAAVQRKHNLMNDLADLYDRAMAHRMTGTKIALRLLTAGSQWFHASPQELPEGTRLVPSGGPSTFDNYEGMNYGGEDRRNHVWVSPSLKDAQQWASIIRDEGNVYPNPVHVYEAHPNQTPQGNPDDGYTVPTATVGRKVYTHDGKGGVRYHLAAPPSEHEMHNEGEALGTNQRAHVFSDPQGQWIIKSPPKGNEYMVPLEVGTAALQKRVGLETPETHAIPFQGGLAVASKRYPHATQAFGGPSGREPISHNQLGPGDLETIQKHQALDWLIGNHDAHVGNWLRTQDGGLVGIDKGQAMKYFGQDRLDPTFHPNYYAREPVYNRLWRQHAKGKGEMADPRQGALGDFVNRLQSIPDDELKGMFAPYAHAAASVGHLATGGPPDPDRKLSPRSIPANDPEAFLDAMVARKNNLHQDLGALYDKATKARSQAQRAHPQPITPGLDPNAPLPHEGARYAAPDGPPAPPKPPAVPTVPGTSPSTTPGATPSATTTTAPGSTNTPGASPLSYSMPQGDQSARKGPAISQHPWDMFGIPVGIPSTYQHTQDQLHQMNPNSSNLNHPTNIQGDPYGNGAGTSVGGGGGSVPGSYPSTSAGGGGRTSPASPGSVPLVQKADGTWTSSNPAWAHLINRESGGNASITQQIHDVNSGGNEAQGLFQITPATWKSHGGDKYGPNPGQATPQQQADIAAEILRRNPSGSDWGAGLAGREDASALMSGLGGQS